MSESDINYSRSGFFVAGDEGNAEAQSLFMCERKTFDDRTHTTVSVQSPCMEDDQHCPGVLS